MHDVDPLTRPGLNIHMKEVGTGIRAVCLELEERQGNRERAADGG